MKAILEEDKEFCTEMEAYLEEWADSVYDVIHTKYFLLKQEAKKVK
jgi:hypothetical protein